MIRPLTPVIFVLPSDIMSKFDDSPYHTTSLLGFQSRFPSERSCLKYLIQTRWPDGFVCPRCKSKHNCFCSRRKVFECYECKRQTSAMAGTIFHRSRIPLRKWFWAIFLISTSKKGIPALYLQKQLGIKSYRAAWLLGQKIRHSMIQRDAFYKLQGNIQTDEIFIGGKQSRLSKNDSLTPTRISRFLVPILVTTSPC